MTQRSRVLLIYVLGNFIPALQGGGAIFILFWDFSGVEKALYFLSWIYVLPVLLTRILFFIFGKPQGVYEEDTGGYRLWYVVAQLQAIFNRFPFFEELLKLFPTFYNNWLRLWGAEVGKLVYWSPRSCVIDRSYLVIKDYALVGYGVRLSGHMVNKHGVGNKLFLAAPTIEGNCILGGESAVGPGALVAEQETLPAMCILPPGYMWKENRKQKMVSLHEVGR